MQTAPGQPNPTVPATPASGNESARAALRDLIALCAECAARETEIEQAHGSALDHAEKELLRVKSNLEQRSKAAREEIEQKAQARVEQIKQQYEAELAELKSNDTGRKRLLVDEFERANQDVQSRLQQSVWLAESVYEGAQNGLREESKKAKELYGNRLAALEDTEKAADALIAKYRQTPPAYFPADEPLEQGADPDKAFDDAKAQGERRLAELKHLSLPRLFMGIKPYIIVPIICTVTAVIANWVASGHPTADADLRAMPIDIKVIALSILGALVFCGALGALLWMMAKSQIRNVYLPMRQSGTTARTAAKGSAEKSAEAREASRSRAIRKRNTEIETVKRQFAPIVARATKNRDGALQTLQVDYDRRLQRIESNRQRQLAETGAWQQQSGDSLEQKYNAEVQSGLQRFEGQTGEGQSSLQQAQTALRQRWHDGLTAIQAPLAAQAKTGGPRLDRWDDPAWKTWTPSKTFVSKIRFGELRVDLKQITDQYPRTLDLPGTFAVPATLTLPQHASLMVHFDRGGRQSALATLQTTMVRLLTNLPAGRVRFTLIDPVGLGQSFAGFMHLADHDDALVGGRIWTEAEHIDQRLADLTEHMETVIQKYLRNEFETIDDYNAQAGELAEPYRFLVIADLPTNFSQESIRRLASIASSGARCGVYTLITRDLRQPIPGGAHLDEIESHSINLLQQADGSYIWNDEVFKQFPLLLDTPPTEDFLTRIMDLVGKGAKEAKRVEVPFGTIAPRADKMWSAGAASELSVPVGRAGATRLQSFKLGRGVAQHALIAGKTGSGKSTLLHAFVTNSAMWYSPDEIEFYLVDFKKGVEFKTYAANELPHARAIAVESDREFGLSVLQRIDAELARRGELYRKAGVQDLASYRQTSGEKMPRTLLIIDEFQEFFSEDDRLAQDASVLLDRLVRQGRAFGIHVLLGSQTIGGTSGLSRSTLGQMAIRIALQTSEADSQLILGDSNSAARLLTRPGEAIYNDAGGLVEGNSPFQVAWLPDEQRDEYLKSVLEKAKTNGAVRREPAIVFEGNAPADITKNRRMLSALAVKEASNQPPKAWLGDPIAIKDATAATFRRQAGANVLMIGQQDEGAMAMMASSILSLAAQSPAATFYVLDGAPADSPLAAVMPRVKAALPNEVKLIEYRATEEAIAELAAELNRRQSSGGANPPPVYLLIYGLQRYRGLRKQEDSFSFGSSDEEKKPQADKRFMDLLRDGPPVGMHVIAWCDTAAALERTLDRAAMREFDNRVLFQMSAADSSNLIDSPLGNKLGQNRALLYSEEQGVSEKFRPYALPSDRWLAYVKQQLAGRVSPG
jgi:S-DNA-T family DNA segregation ATPase FtsK/SpoIIIE